VSLQKHEKQHSKRATEPCSSRPTRARARHRRQTRKLEAHYVKDMDRYAQAPPRALRPRFRPARRRPGSRRSRRTSADEAEWGVRLLRQETGRCAAPVRGSPKPPTGRREGSGGRKPRGRRIHGRCRSGGRAGIAARHASPGARRAEAGGRAGGLSVAEGGVWGALGRRRGWCFWGVARGV
jgi:hypothetical protein